MKPAQLKMSVNSDKVSQLLAVVSDAKETSPFTEQFAERFQFLLDTGDLLVKASRVNFGDGTTTAGEIGIGLQPTDGFLSLCTAFLAGDGDFRIFDHEYSFSQSVENKQ
ncbi:MAG: hypothetical protein MK214_16390 [Thalassotalea sp.]|nr:hypothetical protein [Thalassotalea sp.]